MSAAVEREEMKKTVQGQFREQKSKWNQDTVREMKEEGLWPVGN